MTNYIAKDIERYRVYYAEHQARLAKGNAPKGESLALMFCHLVTVAMEGYEHQLKVMRGEADP
jgi:hypothetical protein